MWNHNTKVIEKGLCVTLTGNKSQYNFQATCSECVPCISTLEG